MADQNGVRCRLDGTDVVVVLPLSKWAKEDFRVAAIVNHLQKADVEPV